MWDVIFNGVPKTEIKIGDTVLDTSPFNSSRPGAFANVTVVKGENTYYGVLLLRDGAVVDVNLSKFGANSKYSDNVLTYTDLEKFMDEQCLFICCSGYYNDTYNALGGWKDLGPTYYEGYYWSCTYRNDSYAGYFLKTNTNMRGATSTSSGSTYCIPVHLVKPATGPMYP